MSYAAKAVTMPAASISLATDNNAQGELDGSVINASRMDHVAAESTLARRILLRARLRIGPMLFSGMPTATLMS